MCLLAGSGGIALTAPHRISLCAAGRVGLLLRGLLRLGRRVRLLVGGSSGGFTLGARSSTRLSGGVYGCNALYLARSVCLCADLRSRGLALRFDGCTLLLGGGTTLGAA